MESCKIRDGRAKKKYKSLRGKQIVVKEGMEKPRIKRKKPQKGTGRCKGRDRRAKNKDESLIVEWRDIGWKGVESILGGWGGGERERPL